MYIKARYKGVFITRACFRDVKIFLHEHTSKEFNKNIITADNHVTATDSLHIKI